jgi:hypothetical protein
MTEVLLVNSVRISERAEPKLVLTDAYVAGFFDGDGSVALEGTPTRLAVGFHQKRLNDGVIDLISEWQPGGTRDERKGLRKGTTTYGARLRYTGKKALSVLRRLSPYLVTRRDSVDAFLPASRENASLSGEWLAGYFDADGCVYADVNKHGGSASVKLSIDTNGNELRGLYLVKDTFGGAIRVRGKTGNCWRWEINAGALQVQQFFGLIAEHLIVKKEQAYFLLGCAKMGHFRDGCTIASKLKLLKRLPHRINDLSVKTDLSSHLAQVRDLKSQQGMRFRHKVGQKCPCGREKLYAKGLCNPCWQSTRYHTRKAPTRPYRRRERAPVKAV